jgi:transcriptional regulator with XRE-family HTH domain
MTNMMTLQEAEIFLGEQFRMLRLLKNLDRESLAKMAGVSLKALRNLESGSGANVKTLILVARALGRMDWLTSIAPKISINPLHMVRGKPQRQRASRRKKDA